MSLLGMLQAVCGEVGLPEPESIIGSAGQTERQLLRITHRVLNDLSMYAWPQLERRGTITLATGVDRYALAADLDSHVFDTTWNQDQNYPLWGPFNAQSWESLKNGLVGSASLHQVYRISGYSGRQFEIDPVPTASEDGQVLVYRYNTKNRTRPQTWAAGQVYGVGAYTFYDGNYYKTSLGGSTGGTPPTHTSGSASDGGVTWTFSEDDFSSFRADTDESILDESLLGLGVQWNYLASKNLPYEHLKQKFYSDIETTIPKVGSAPELYMGGRFAALPWPISNVPETGFGGV